jgi:CrcB protein
MRVFLIGLGGFVGAVFRYWVSGAAQGAASPGVFPIGTLVVNVTGCFLIGVLAELVEARGFLGPDARALLFVGVLGGFTTFSAFANETVGALRVGAVGVAIGNVLLTVTACLLAVWAGRAAAFAVWR